MARLNYMSATRTLYQHRWWRRNMHIGNKVSWLLSETTNWASRSWLIIPPKYIPIAKWEPSTHRTAKHDDN